MLKFRRTRMMMSLVMLVLFPLLYVFPVVEGTGEISPTAALAGPMVNWNTTWGGPAADKANALAVDASGNIYVTGLTYSWITGLANLWIGSFTPAGSLRWNNSWGGPSYDIAEDVAVDASGNVYVAGYSSSWSGTYRLLLQKYNGQNGALIWNFTWGGPGNAVGYALALDATGNLYVTGYTNNWLSSIDVLLQKYDADGNLIWNKTWGGLNTDEGEGIIINAAGKLYVAGWTQNPDNNILLAKFDATTGAYLGDTSWGGPNNDYGHDLAIDTAGDIYVVGETEWGEFGGKDVWLGRFNPGGGLIWNNSLGGSGDDNGYCVSVAPSGDIYIGGWTTSWSEGTYDALWAKYDELGNLRWSSIWGGLSNDYFFGITFDQSGNALLSGSTWNWGGSTSEEILLIAFTESISDSWWMIDFLGVPVWAWMIIAAESTIVVFLLVRSRKGKKR